MEAEQRVVIRTDPNRWRVTADGLIEQAAKVRAVDGFEANAESDDAAGEHIDDHKEPMVTPQDRLATKQINAPEAVLDLCEEGERGRTRGARMIWAVMSCKDPADDILIDLHVECIWDLLGNALIAESGVAMLRLEDGRADFLCRTLRAWLAPGSGRGEQAPILSIEQRLVES